MNTHWSTGGYINNKPEYMFIKFQVSTYSKLLGKGESEFRSGTGCGNEDNTWSKRL